MNKVLKFTDIEIDGIDHRDAPKYVDAFIASASAVLDDGTIRDATEEELQELNNDYDLVYEQIINKIY